MSLISPFSGGCTLGSPYHPTLDAEWRDHPNPAAGSTGAILPRVRLAAGRIPAWTLGWHLFQQLPRTGRFVSWRRSQWFKFLALQELSGFQAWEKPAGELGEASCSAAGIQLHGLLELRYLCSLGSDYFRSRPQWVKKYHRCSEWANPLSPHTLPLHLHQARINPPL